MARPRAPFNLDQAIAEAKRLHVPEIDVSSVTPKLLQLWKQDAEQHPTNIDPLDIEYSLDTLEDLRPDLEFLLLGGDEPNAYPTPAPRGRPDAGPLERVVRRIGWQPFGYYRKAALEDQARTIRERWKRDNARASFGTTSPAPEGCTVRGLIREMIRGSLEQAIQAADAEQPILFGGRVVSSRPSGWPLLAAFGWLAWYARARVDEATTPERPDKPLVNAAPYEPWIARQEERAQAVEQAGEDQSPPVWTPEERAFFQEGLVRLDQQMTMIDEIRVALQAIGPNKPGLQSYFLLHYYGRRYGQVEPVPEWPNLTEADERRYLRVPQAQIERYKAELRRLRLRLRHASEGGR